MAWMFVCGASVGIMGVCPTLPAAKGTPDAVARLGVVTLQGLENLCHRVALRRRLVGTGGLLLRKTETNGKLADERLGGKIERTDDGKRIMAHRHGRRDAVERALVGQVHEKRQPCGCTA